MSAIISKRRRRCGLSAKRSSRLGSFSLQPRLNWHHIRPAEPRLSSRAKKAGRSGIEQIPPSPAASAPNPELHVRAVRHRCVRVPPCVHERRFTLTPRLRDMPYSINWASPSPIPKGRSLGEEPVRCSKFEVRCWMFGFGILAPAPSPLPRARRAGGTVIQLSHRKCRLGPLNPALNLNLPGSDCSGAGMRGSAKSLNPALLRICISPLLPKASTSLWSM